MIRQVFQILQSCPVVGRSLDSATEHLGRPVTCQHCHCRDPVPVQMTVLLVEDRDEVFAGLANCLSMVGLRAVQAKTGTDAIRRYVRQPPALLMVNADHPAESAWLLVAKLHLTHPAARFWAYKRRLSPPDVSAAKFLHVDELIEYRGDLSKVNPGNPGLLQDHLWTTGFTRRRRGSSSPD